ncbi:MAG TPA: nitroreductase family protein [Nitrososphaeraceae archaeon]|jgi:nitroreductase|nr:nitroreductase family protein [Nitrososphaeraceae archaeon]
MRVSKTDESRKSTYPINPLILNRWSPRAMTGGDLDNEEIMPLFEAARWAPSSYNNQPWRFIYAKRNTEHWDRLFNLLADGNKTWAKNSALLVVVISRKNFEYNEKPARTYQYDAGSAWENLALEAFSRGLVAHGMQGFDYEKARFELEIPSDFEVMAMIAIGKKGPRESLPTDLQEKERLTDRKPLKDIVMEGIYRK